MKQFLDDDFLLNHSVAKKLYRDFAKDLPVIDYHCHINPKEIADNVTFGDITDLWLGEDHYKWRVMRACGIEEKYITGDAPNRDKFMKWAEVMPKLIGNPLFHWSHLELKKYFGYEGILSKDSAQEVWELCNEKLSRLSVKDIIEMSHVEVICTTDDPADSLQYHQKIRESGFDVRVLPTWRPDRLLSIEKEDFSDYIRQLSDVSGISINSFETLKQAVRSRMDFFEAMQCRIADHSLSYIMYEPASAQEVDTIFTGALNNMPVDISDALKFKTECLKFMAEEYHRRGWVMQLHYGVMRNCNSQNFQILGADTGFDCIGDHAPISSLVHFLDDLTAAGKLPKTILYSLNPTDNTAIDTAIGCFQDSVPLGKIQHGCAWWFNDHKAGITSHLTSLANQGVLGNFIGMLTDSRSFLSYTRHDYFRRILCDFIGKLVEQGEYPMDYDLLGNLVRDICYFNVKKFIGL